MYGPCVPRCLLYVLKGTNPHQSTHPSTIPTTTQVARFKNPWEELTFQYAGQQGKERAYSSEEDRYLLCFTNHYGYGNWEVCARVMDMWTDVCGWRVWVTFGGRVRVSTADVPYPPTTHQHRTLNRTCAWPSGAATASASTTSSAPAPPRTSVRALLRPSCLVYGVGSCMCLHRSSLLSSPLTYLLHIQASAASS